MLKLTASLVLKWDRKNSVKIGKKAPVKVDRNAAVEILPSKALPLKGQK